MTYSLDFRKKVLEIKKEKKLSFEKTAKLFNLGKSTLQRWEKRIVPILKRNKPATKLNMEALKKDVAEYPDGYLKERAKRLNVSASCVFYALKRVNISYKKKRYNIPKETKKREKHSKKK